MSDIIREIEAEQLKEKVDDFGVGDTVRVYNKIKEGSRERVQVFERLSPSESSPTESVWRRHGPCIPPMWRRSR